MKIFTKLEKRNSIDIVFFVMITRKNICLICQKIFLKNKLIYFFLKKKKNSLFGSKIFIVYEVYYKDYEASYISKRYSQVNNKYWKPYDPKQDSQYITYLDANDLYGYGMSKFFPTGKFEWINPKDFDLDKYKKNS